MFFKSVDRVFNGNIKYGINNLKLWLIEICVLREG